MTVVKRLLNFKLKMSLKAHSVDFNILRVKSSLTFCCVVEASSYLLSINADEHCPSRRAENKTRSRQPGKHRGEKKKTVRMSSHPF